MSETVAAHGQGREAERVDVSVLEQIEHELDAVERALEQIDEGVYEGFAGVGGMELGAEPADLGAAGDV